jgi:prolyl oligopeptidase
VDVLEWASPVNEDKLILCYLHDVKSVLQLHDLNTGAKLQDVPLEVGSVVSHFAKRSHDEAFFKFDSYLIPGTIYRIDFTKQQRPYVADVRS